MPTPDFAWTGSDYKLREHREEKKSKKEKMLKNKTKKKK